MSVCSSCNEELVAKEGELKWQFSRRATCGKPECVRASRMGKFADSGTFLRNPSGKASKKV